MVSMTSDTPFNPSHLPIAHPDYRYPSSRNPYWKKLSDVESGAFLDAETENKKGQWRSHFPKESTDLPLHVEIGCNGGHVILEWAKQFPHQRYIGVDWKFKQIYRGWEKAQKHQLENLIFLRSHAFRLKYVFAPEEIDFLYVYFPDPWPKKSAWKNRVVQASWLTEVASLVKPGGVLHIKTDHDGYFDWMEEEFPKVSSLWKPSEVTRDLHARHPNPLKLDFPDVTLFEKLFIRDQIKINSVKLIRI